jgi:hypothetical protein
MQIDNTLTNCKICGGQLGKKKAYDVIHCLCCDDIKNIQHKDIEILNEANKYRNQKEFAKALNLYLEMLKVDADFPPANWGALLSEYGVEYIEENKKLIPTIYRPISNFNILENIYSINLLKNSKDEDKVYYQQKIEELEFLRIDIEESLRNLPAFDVFISCKITKPESESKEKTDDYKAGLIIYRKLVQKGLKVFFSPEILPSTNGKYEPIIYSALQSSKYLIVVALESYYLESTWIKNEWERFLSLSKIERHKKFKLIIKSSMESKVPSRLLENSYIEYSEGLYWLSNLEKAIEEAFPEFKDNKFKFENKDIDYIDLDLVKRFKSKKIEKRNVSKNEGLVILPFNPYTVNITKLQDSYTLDDNIKICIQIVEIHLRNNKFAEAKVELNKYLNFVDSSKDLDYNILILKLLILTKSNSIEDFLTEKVENLDDFKIFDEAVSKLSVDHIENFVTLISEFIIKSIKNKSRNNAFNLYQSISSIDSAIINNLHEQIIINLPALYNDPEYLNQFANVSLPYLANNNIHQYIHLTSALADGLCKSGMYEHALYFAESVLKINPLHNKSRITRLMSNLKVSSQLELFQNIEQNDKFKDLEETISTFDEIALKNYLKAITNHILSYLSNQKFEYVTQWISCLTNLGFIADEKYLKYITDICKKDIRTSFILIHLFGLVDELSLKYLIEVTSEFSLILIRNQEFLNAKKLLKEAIEYDQDNLKLTYILLSAELETSSLLSPDVKINKLNDMSILEKILISKSSNFEKQEFLIKLINMCVKYVSKSNDFMDEDNIFYVFDKLLSYYPQIKESKNILSKIDSFAKECLNQKLFEKAIWYFVTVIRIDETYHRAYWGILLAKNKCISGEELIRKKISVSDSEEFRLAVQHSKGDVESENEYTKVLILKASQERNSKKTLTFATLTIVVIIVILLLTFINGGI